VPSPARSTAAAGRSSVVPAGRRAHSPSAARSSGLYSRGNDGTAFGAPLGSGGSDALVIYTAGVWYVDRDLDGVTDLVYDFGGAPGDTALAGDIDGDGDADLAIYRGGLWFVSTRRDGVADIVRGFGGAPGDIPLLADMNGDGKADLGLYRNGTWLFDTTGTASPTSQ
jgi:hypothetical protein